MKPVIARPRTQFGPGAGLFRNDHFQIAYATNDIDRACALFGERYGVKEFRRLEGNLAAGGKIRMEIAWAGGVMYELLWAQGPGSDVFRAGLPDSDDFAIRPHHLGYCVATAPAWEALQDDVQQAGLRVVHKTSIKDFLQAIIVEEPALGHFLEYIFPDPGGIAFFENAPSN